MPQVQTIVLVSALVLSTVLLSACGGGGSSSSTTSTLTPVATATPDATGGTSAGSGSGSGTTTGSITAPNASVSSTAPVISGEPPTEVSVGEAYSFKPVASDPNGDQLTFSVANLPHWANFDSGTGSITGTPTEADVGTYANIQVSVSDSQHKAALRAYSISVVQMGSGTATVSWSPPLKNTDGSTLTDLSGFQIHFGRSAGSLTQIVKIKNSSISRYVIENLSAGAWYFAVSAVNSKGAQSSLSTISSKVI